jgi:hypothetical protein
MFFLSGRVTQIEVVSYLKLPSDSAFGVTEIAAEDGLASSRSNRFSPLRQLTYHCIQFHF